jgi:hypothetical protein
MSNRITYRDRGAEFYIFIAPKVNTLQLLVILASLSPFLFFLFRFAKNMRDATKGGSGSLLPLLGGLLVWALSGIFWLYSIVVNVFGKEIVTISDGRFSIRKSFLGRGPKREFRTSDISNMRIHGLRVSGPSIMSQFAPAGVSIVFDYQGKTHRFGNQLLEREARFMLDRMKSKLPASAFAEPKMRSDQS